MAISQLARGVRPHDVVVPRAAARLAYIDNLRIALVAGVILHHAAQSYGPTGGDWPVFNPTRAAILGPFFTVNASFALGLFFLVAGYFMPGAYDRKGAGGFLKERLVRLGLPLLFVSLVLLMPFVYIFSGQGRPFGPFLASYLRQPQAGHMWFVANLLIFACGYGAWRWLTGRGGPAPQPGAAPSHRAILSYTLGLAAVTFVVRLAFPVDRWVDLAPFVRVEWAHMPQYLSLFVVGAMAYRGDWLSRLPTNVGMTWLKIGLAAAAVPYAVTILHELASIDIPLNTSGLSLGTLAWNTIEALIAVGLCVGLLTLFRERVNRQGALLRELAPTSYATYVIHIFPVLGLQFALAASPLPPLVKFGVVALLALPLSFGLAYGLRKLPGVRKVI